MAQTSWPFENIDTTEVQFSQWARHINEGIRPDFANELEVFADDSGLNVKVKSGQAMVRGHYYASTAEETLTITNPDATNPRIDSVVLELDIVANSILLKVVAGTPDASPVAPTLTQSEDGNVYQFLLGNVAVAAGVFSIAAGDVTDLRTYMFQGVGKWTTATRPANPIDYQTIGYNTELNTHEVWNGTAWTSVFAPITTEGDLAIGDDTGTAVRLPIGAADTVLTSDGTTATWVEAAGGGAIALFSITKDSINSFAFEIPVNTMARFSIIADTADTFNFNAFDSSGNVIQSFLVDRDNPFTYFSSSTAVASIGIFNTVATTLKPILAITDPKTATDADTKDSIVIDTTQSITLTKTYDAFVFGAGGGGGGSYNSGSSVGAGGGGGGSGFLSTGQITAGTYTATIGAGGASSDFDGSAGGASSIGAITANGGDGAENAVSLNTGGPGAAGGSGGGGGATTNNYGIDRFGGDGGQNGADGEVGAARGGTGGTAGSGSGTIIPGASFLSNSAVYIGGAGGNAGTSGPGDADTPASGGPGGPASTNLSNFREAGRAGTNGYIFLVEA